MKQIILCADDFGLNQGISQGILKLVHMGRLSAVSCMTNRDDFSKNAEALLSFKSTIQIGLHFNLTEGLLLSEPGKPCFDFKKLLLGTQLRCISPQWIARELGAQMNRYIEIMGAYPGFIDGHQHIHQLPIIRDVILKYYQQNLQDKGIRIRSTYPAVTLPKYRLKAKIMDATGGKTFHSLLKQNKILHNSWFSGVYDFSTLCSYRDVFKQWLNKAKSDTLIMCHPGEGNHPDDVIQAARLQEMTYFLSDAFLMDCDTYQVSLAASPVS